MSDDNTGVDNTEKDPKDWATGDEPATGAQLSYLNTMAQTNNETVPKNLTKADASVLIEKMQKQTE